MSCRKNLPEQNKLEDKSQINEATKSEENFSNEHKIHSSRRKSTQRWFWFMFLDMWILICRDWRGQEVGDSSLHPSQLSQLIPIPYPNRMWGWNQPLSSTQWRKSSTDPQPDKPSPNEELKRKFPNGLIVNKITIFPDFEQFLWKNNNNKFQLDAQYFSAAEFDYNIIKIKDRSKLA